MRVLMLYNDYQRAGGERRSVAEEAAGLLELGHEVEVLQVSNETITSRARAVRSLVETRDSKALVSSRIDTFRPDIIHAQNIFPQLGPGAIAAIHDSGLPWVRTLRNYRLRCIAATLFLDGEECHRCSSAAHGWQGVIHRCYRESIGASIGAVTYANLERRATKRYSPDAYIVLSAAMKPLLRAQTNDTPVFVKPNIVAQPAGAEVAAIRNRSGFLFVGRLTAEKNADILLQVASIRPDLAIRIVGDGPERAALAARAANLRNVSFLGELSQEHVTREMSSARAVVVPSAWEEPFGRVAAEALAVGTPPIVANRGGLPDIAAQVGSPALIVDADHEDAWAASIDFVQSMSPAQFATLEVACREAWQRAFSPAAVSTQLERIYQQVLSGTQTSELDA